MIFICIICLLFFVVPTTAYFHSVPSRQRIYHCSIFMSNEPIILEGNIDLDFFDYRCSL
jgi:hypothetical protein